MRFNRKETALFEQPHLSYLNQYKKHTRRSLIPPGIFFIKSLGKGFCYSD